ncbi:hypothetical protein F4808DRAFT_433960 [Astrocystis sublimbata]|nr:hypothetical protein F4808DRAFT_433960 [Astrocystis sublimbata]
MEDNSRRRRQEQAASSTSNNARYLVADSNASRQRYTMATGLDRYRHAASSASSPAPRSMGSAVSYSGYYQEPGAASFSQSIPQSTISYTPEYAHDSRQPQGYNAYNTSIIYNVPQASGQSSVYDANQQFSSRQGAGLQQIIPSDVAAPYFPGEPSNAAATAALQPQAAPSSTTGVYQQSPTDQRMLQQSYSGAIAPMNALAQAESEQIVEDEEYTATAAASAPAQTSHMGEAYEHYQNALKEIFTNVQNCVLQSASESLLGVSEWLLVKVAELGLTADEENLHEDRVKLWRDYNHAWLALCQRQIDAVESGVALQRGQTLLSDDSIRTMGDTLVRLCNGIERHGLVDYEYGVWEELIIEALERCLDLSAENRK